MHEALLPTVTSLLRAVFTDSDRVCDAGSMFLPVLQQRTFCAWGRNHTDVAKTVVHGRLSKPWTAPAGEHEGPAAPDSATTRNQQQQHDSSSSTQPEGVSTFASAAVQQQDHLHTTAASRDPGQLLQTSKKGSPLLAAQAFVRQYGTGAFLSFITFSNVVSVVMLSSAWILFTKTAGATPLATGQWPKFLMFYAGAYAMQHVARPLKMAVGLAGASVGTAAVDWFADMLGVDKNIALALLLLIEAVLLLCCLGCVAMYASRMAATTAAVAR